METKQDIIRKMGELKRGFSDKKRRFKERTAEIDAAAGAVAEECEQTEAEIARVEAEIQANKDRDRDLTRATVEKKRSLKERSETNKQLEQKAASMDRQAQRVDVIKAARFIIHRIGVPLEVDDWTTLTQAEGGRQRRKANREDGDKNADVKEAEFVLSVMHAITSDVEKAIAREPKRKDFGIQGGRYYPYADQNWPPEDIGTFVDFQTEDECYKVMPIHENGICITEEGFRAVVEHVADVVTELKELFVDEERNDFSAARLFADFSSAAHGTGRYTMHQLAVHTFDAFVPKDLRKMFCGRRGNWRRNRFTDMVMEGIEELLPTAMKEACKDQCFSMGKELEKPMIDKVVSHVKHVIVRLANNYKLTEITNRTLAKLFEDSGKAYTYLGIRNLHVHARDYDSDLEVDKSLVKLVKNARRVCGGAPKVVVKGELNGQGQLSDSMEELDGDEMSDEDETDIRLEAVDLDAEASLEHRLSQTTSSRE